jgi:hypothetical protein
MMQSADSLTLQAFLGALDQLEDPHRLRYIVAKQDPIPKMLISDCFL